MRPPQLPRVVPSLEDALERREHEERGDDEDEIQDQEQKELPGAAELVRERGRLARWTTMWFGVAVIPGPASLDPFGPRVHRRPATLLQPRFETARREPGPRDRRGAPPPRDLRVQRSELAGGQQRRDRVDGVRQRRPEAVEHAGPDDRRD